MLAIHRSPLSPAILSIAAVAIAAGACKAPRSFGDANSVIVRADSTLWADVEDTVRAALERPVFTTRNETEFKVTFVAEGDTLWDDFRLWRNVLLLGSRGEPVVDRVLRAANGDARPPAVLQASDIWAGDQQVRLILLPEQGRAEAVRSQLDEVYSALRAQFEAWVRDRMYASAVNDSLADVLSAFGFSLDIPNVYLHRREDSIFRFRNVLPNPADRIRSLLVTWESSDRFATGMPGPSELRDWRRRIGETLYDPPQDIVDGTVRFDTVTVGEREGLEMRAVWQDRSDFPAAGPVIVRAVACPSQDRVYFVDAWLYAPSEDKFQFILQLEFLLDSFRCSNEEPLDIASSGGR